MPWLSRAPSRQVSETVPTAPSSPVEMKQPKDLPQTSTKIITTTVEVTKKTMPISFIPAQIDGMCSTAAPHTVLQPTTVLREQMMALLRNLPCLLSVPKVMMSGKMWREYVNDPMACRDLALQVGMGLMQCCMLFCLPPLMMIMPGLMSLFVMAVCWAMNMAMCYPLNDGSRVNRVVPEGVSVRALEEMADEEWVFVGGMMTSHYSHMKHLHRMARTFGRPVTGIHCRTYGPIIDMMMAMMHPYMPSATGPAVTSTLRTSLLNTSTRKVIVLGHSTGCLPLNTSLDCLHADLPSVCMSKLEIYTFGSAARHMHNPLLVLDELSLPSIGISMPINGTNNSSSPTIGGIGDGRNRSRSPNPQWTRADGSIASPVKATLKSAGYRVEDLERVIPHIEHYAFESAMAARCGILEAVKGGRSRLAGRVFVLGSNEKKQMTNGNHAPVEAQSTMIWWSSMVTKLTAMAFDVPPLGGYSAMGTMDEYIDALFPCTTASSTSTLMSILDTIPSIDISTAERREFIAQSTAPPMLASRKLSFGLGLASPSSKSMTNGGLSPTMTNGNGITSRKDKRNSWNTSASLGIDGVGKARQCARESSGRTVRQLSRLWNYVNGKKPVGEGVALVNGVGNGVGMVDHMGKMMNGHGMQGNGMTNGGAMAMADMGMNGVKQEVMASA